MEADVNRVFRYSAQTVTTATTTMATAAMTTKGDGDGDDGAENFFEI